MGGYSGYTCKKLVSKNLDIFFDKIEGIEGIPYPSKNMFYSEKQHLPHQILVMYYIISIFDPKCKFTYHLHYEQYEFNNLNLLKAATEAYNIINNKQLEVINYNYDLIINFFGKKHFIKEINEDEITEDEITEDEIDDNEDEEEIIADEEDKDEYWYYLENNAENREMLDKELDEYWNKEDQENLTTLNEKLNLINEKLNLILKKLKN